IHRGGPKVVAERLRPHADETLAAVFRNAGSTSGAVSANLWISQRSGFDVGFDRFESVLVPRQPRASSSVRDRLGWLLDVALARVDDGARAAEEILTRWLAERPTGPFFWFVNLCECHSPYLPPKPYNDLSLRLRILAGR